MPELNFFDNYVMMAITEEIVPKVSFFRDRYFPTGANDIFNADKVLTEYRKGDRKMACFVAPRSGDIPVDRRGYEIHEYQPAYIAPSRLLTLDELNKRGFGEAFYPGSTKAQRAARLQLDDLTDLDRRILRREEWMCVQTMLNNACTMREYIDANTAGEVNSVYFYDSTSDHTYTVSSKWDAAGGDFFGDVETMCDQLAERGLPAEDLIIGTGVSKAIKKLPEVRELLKKDSGIITGEINAKLTKYPGVTFLGTLNFNGYELNIFCVKETYVDDNNITQRYFPAKGAIVTAPECGHLMYGNITQINHGSTEYETYAAKRVPKLVIDQDKDTRKIRLGARPLAAPKDYCPYIYAENAVN